MIQASRSQITAALGQLAALNIRITDLLLFLLLMDQEQFDFTATSAVNDLSDNYLTILDLFKTHPVFANGINLWIHRCAAADFKDEVKKLAKKSTGWHGYARSSTVEQFDTLDTMGLALTAKQIAPTLWNVLDQLFGLAGHSDHGDDSADDDINGDEDNMMDLDEPDTPGPSNELIDSEYKIRELVCPLMTLLK